MKYRNGELVDLPSGQDPLLGLLYGSVWGRLLIRPLVSPAVSRVAGCFLSSGLSKGLIQPFIRRNNIDMTQFEQADYHSYNDFFSRKIRAEMRPIDQNAGHLIAPCDSRLTVMPISADTRFCLKHTEYTVESLVRNRRIAEKYTGGYALIFRLTVSDYHRYCYVADGEKEENVQIPGVFHTVNPVANDYFPIYKENTREYSILHSDAFGDVLMMEVGALLVGRIVNLHGKTSVKRGQEKGFFQFGGSTVVLLLQKNNIEIDGDITENSRQNIETVVRMGEKIGRALAAEE